MDRIFIIEDDEFLREELTEVFLKDGSETIAFSGTEDILKSVEELRPKLIVLDINLPIKSGFEICREIKSRRRVPVLMLTARDALGDELSALSLGADDYLTKPCNKARLLARAHGLIERYRGVFENIICRGLELDPLSQKLSYGGKVIILQETVSRVLFFLMQNYPGTVSKEELIRFVWGGEFFDKNILSVNIARLRRELSALGLESAVVLVRSVGYRLEL